MTLDEAKRQINMYPNSPRVPDGPSWRDALRAGRYCFQEYRGLFDAPVCSNDRCPYRVILKDRLGPFGQLVATSDDADALKFWFLQTYA